MPFINVIGKIKTGFYFWIFLDSSDLNLFIFCLSPISLMIVCFLVGISQNLYASSDEKKMIARTFAFLKVDTAVQYLKPYLSTKGKITAVWESNTIIISDIPEVVEMLDNLINVIDVPLTEIQFTIDLISGSRVKDSKGDTDKELRDDPLIKELQGVLKYNSFKNMGATIIRVQNNSSSTHWLAKNLQLIIAPQATPEGSIVVELTLLNYRGIDKKGKAIKTVLVQTKLTIKNKEKTVVGVSKLNGDDNALILFITGSFIDNKYGTGKNGAYLRLNVLRKSILLPKQTHPGCFAATPLKRGI